MKKIVLLIVFTSSLLFASQTKGLVGLYSGSSSDDYEVTVSSNKETFSEDNSFAMLRLGTYIGANTRVYFETYNFSSEDRITHIALKTLNFDFLTGSEKTFFKPFLGLSILDKKYATNSNNTNVDVETNNFSFKAGLVMNITESFELEVGAMQNFLEVQEESTNGSTDEDTSFWYYFGLTIKFDPPANFFTLR